MKIKVEFVYGDEICEGLKEAFDCDTDDELFAAFRVLMKHALVKEGFDSEDLSIKCERID